MTKLISTQNTQKVERLVKQLARGRFPRQKASPVFEHDHWWLIVDNGEDEDSIFDVVDAEPGFGTTGLDVEQVS